MYSPRTSKALLPHNSAHSKLTKRGIATLCCRSALEKSCQHRVRESLAYQVERMSKAGYPSELIWSCCERILQNVKTEGKGKQPSAAKQPVHVMPYVHRLSHNVKKVANRFGVKTVFTAPCKLAKVCAMMHKEKRSVCNKRHAKVFTECTSGVVYEIPLTCGSVYIGQTGRCFNERAREHSLAVRTNTGGHLDFHCRRCGCMPSFEDTVFLSKSRNKLQREVVEAYFINKKSDHCVSMPSLTLLQKELQFLDGFVWMTHSVLIFYFQFLVLSALWFCQFFAC